jgi:predicted extracellular nuclease
MRFINKKIMLFMTNVFLLAGIGSTIANYSTSVIQGEAANASDLFFSQYIEGSSNNKMISIFNGTGSAVNLSSYSIIHYNNGASESTGARYTHALPNLSLPNGGTYTLYNASATASFKPSLLSISLNTNVMTFNGDDALSLKKNGSIIDVFGIIGFDPGTSWSETAGGIGFVFGFKDTSVTGQTTDRTLVRLKSVNAPKNNASITYNNATYTNGAFDPLEWGVYDTDTSKFVGWHSYQNFTSGSFAQNFIQSTTDNGGSCTSDGLSWSILQSDYNSMTSDEKNLFVAGSANSTIANAVTRYQYLRTITPSLNNFASL